MKQGFININKASGDPSTRPVGQMKRCTHMPCGHMGTLDPLASGVLPVGVGRATRLFDYFLDKKKTYIATFLFGEDYDTLDITGRLSKTGGYVPTKEEVASVLPQFIGEIGQVPPKFSAKCVNGRRGYELARSGVDFELAAKTIRIDDIELLDIKDNAFRFAIDCGGGTYIRSLGRDIAAAVHTTAAMSALCRTRSGVFTIEKAVPMEQITEENVESYIVPTEDVLPFARISLNDAAMRKILCGVPVLADYADGLYKLFLSDGSFYGVAEVQSGLAKVKIKLC